MTYKKSDIFLAKNLCIYRGSSNFLRLPMIDKVINIDAEDNVRKEELYHDRKLKKELAKYNINFDVQTIVPHGMRARKRKNKNIN